jgi:aryl-alcohol dehydrogenase-like predicted oxidoreductase
MLLHGETTRVGLGGAMLSLTPGITADRARATIVAALDAGIRLLDTAAGYVPRDDCLNHNEKLIASALRQWGGNRDEVTVVTKAGHARFGDGFPTDARPEVLVAAAEPALRALETDVLDVMMLHWPDPTVPIAESAAGLRALLDDGLIRGAGLSNVSVAQLREAQAVCPISVVQNKFSPDRPVRDVFDVCSAEGIAFMAYSPLGGGGSEGSRSLAERHPEFAAVARERGVSVQQVVLAWEIAQGPAMFAVCGATRPQTARDSAAAMALELSAAEVERLDHAVVGAQTHHSR